MMETPSNNQPESTDERVDAAFAKITENLGDLQKSPFKQAEEVHGETVRILKDRISEIFDPNQTFDERDNRAADTEAFARYEYSNTLKELLCQTLPQNETDDDYLPENYEPTGDTLLAEQDEEPGVIALARAISEIVYSDLAKLQREIYPHLDEIYDNTDIATTNAEAPVPKQDFWLMLVGEADIVSAALPDATEGEIYEYIINKACDYASDAAASLVSQANISAHNAAVFRELQQRDERSRQGSFGKAILEAIQKFMKHPGSDS